VARSYDRFYIGGEWVAPAGSDLLEVISRSPRSHRQRPRAWTRTSTGRAAAREAFDMAMAHAQPLERRLCGQIRRGLLLPVPRDGQPDHRADGLSISFSSQIQAPRPAACCSTSWAGGRLPVEERRAGIIGGDVLVRREPLGVVGVIAPWNVPQLVIMSRVSPP